MSRKPPLQSASHAAPSVQKAVLDALADARTALQAPARSHAVRIHDMRKALKRLRALLRLMTPVLGEEAVDMRLQARDLARELGGTRDAQSALDAVRDLHKGRSNADLSERSMKSIGNKLAQLKQSSRHAQLSADTKLRLLAWIDSMDARVRIWPSNSPEFPILAHELTRNYRRARRAMPEKWMAASDEDLHKFRQRVIVHRNQLDLIAPLRPRLVTKWINAAQRIRGRLGRYQDLTLLVRLSQPGQPLAPWRTRLQNDVKKRQREHLEAAERSAARFFDASPKSFGKRIEALAADREQV
jgi:CHAD domain-containing protein